MGETKKNDIVTAIENAEVVNFGKRDMNTYSSLTNKIEKGFMKASEAYVTIGCALWQIHHNEFYRIDNYKSIAEYAEDKFEIKKATTHNYIKVIEKFGEIVDGKALGLKEEFKPFKCSQLVCMLTFTPAQIEQVQPDWTTRKIIAFGKSPLVVEDAEEVENDGASLPDSEETSSDVKTGFMSAPEIESSRVMLDTYESFEELINEREKLESAFNDMKKDKNFSKKKIRFVLELAIED